MKPLIPQTPKTISSSSSNRSIRSKETPQSKVSSKDASCSSSSNAKQQTIVCKSLDLDFDAVSEDRSVDRSDPTLISLDLESSVEGQDLASCILHQLVISSKIVENQLEDLLKDSLAEFKSTTKNLDSVIADLGLELRNTNRWSDEISWMKIQAGLSLFLILMVAVSSFMTAAEKFEGELSFHGLYPT